MSIDLILQNNPNLRPRDEVRIVSVEATPYPDRRRVKVEVEITPFRERPNLEIALEDAQGRIAASSSVIALMQFKMAFNLHVRGADDPAGQYIVRVLLYYEDIQTAQDTRQAELTIPAAQSG
jgi:hypothetical protein